MITLKEEWYVVINTYNFTIFGDVDIFCIYHTDIAVHAIPTYQVYQLYDVECFSG